MKRHAFGWLLFGLGMLSVIALWQYGQSDLKSGNRPAPVNAASATAPTVARRDEHTSPAPATVPDNAPADATQDGREAAAKQRAEEWIRGGFQSVLYAKPTLGLSPEEMDRVTRTYVAFLARKAEIEKSIAVVVSFEAGTLTIDIPAYPEAGAKLKAELIDQLQQEVSPAAFTRLSERFADLFDVQFAFFGIPTQSYAISLAPGSNENVNIKTITVPPRDDDPQHLVPFMNTTHSILGYAELYCGPWSGLRDRILQYFPALRNDST